MVPFLLVCILIVLLFGGAGLAWAAGGVIGFVLIAIVGLFFLSALAGVVVGAAEFFSELGLEMALAFREWFGWLRARAQRK